MGRRLINGATVTWLEQAREFLREASSGPVLLDEAATVACLSPYHFHRTFTRVFGETPHAFVTRQRIDRAKALLAGTDLTVLEICLAVGYQSVGTFSRRFTALVGRSPTDYRRGVRPLLLAVPATASDRIWTPRFIPACFTAGWA
ncbi:helix-turn-helix domain-containing protein [Actinopolymorpha alba]|uniref:helix-turn-helix domain-containing protein n=1 Tax=Actinopolymorpha alba TaxID=533267 RepID=UPI000365ACD7|nr:AraC family transcriptional regulator [Actinopolymorpha alba]